MAKYDVRSPIGTHLRVIGQHGGGSVLHVDGVERFVLQRGFDGRPRPSVNVRRQQVRETHGHRGQRIVGGGGGRGGDDEPVGTDDLRIQSLREMLVGKPTRG